jgi:3-deoxy-manno-octulosonate cytidylyltransferase (CMP-KDO synthetase)
MSFKVVIPARYASTRLPGKPLIDIAGKPMIAHVYERALESGANEVIIATDDERIKQAAESFGATVCMTSAEHQTGTDRIAEVAVKYSWDDDVCVVNLQGDEPLMKPELVKQVAEDLNAYEQAGIATLCTPIHTTADLFDPHIVKVVLDKDNFAMYFSRASIPWDRDAFSVTTEELPANSMHYAQIGIYAYRVGFLQQYTKMEPCYPERTESLEQLRAMWHGIRIHVSITNNPPAHGVDTEKDLEKVRQHIQNTNK